MDGNIKLKNKRILQGVNTHREKLQSDPNAPIQQSDYLKEYLEMIRTKGLQLAYSYYGDDEPGPLEPNNTATARHWTKNWICIKFAACKLKANSKFAHGLPKIIVMM